MRNFTSPAITGALILCSAAAVAQAVYTLAATMNLTPDGVVSVATEPMPHGWFASKNVLDRRKTDLRGTLAFAGTSCSDPRSTFTFSSVAQGQFSPVLNPQGQTRAWTWSFVGDLASAQNHFYVHTHCDGTSEIHGCDAPIDVAGTLTAFDPKTNTCRTVDSSGECATAPLSGVLEPVRDPDVVDTQCDGQGGDGPDCGIGTCVSACEQDCSAIENKGERQQCKGRCVCECKLQRPAGCPRPDDCN